MTDQMRALWDCRARDGQYAELILPGTRETATILKGVRNSDFQAISDIRIRRAPQDEDELRQDDDARTLLVAIGLGDRLRYDRVIILRLDEQEDVSGIIETVQRFCPELIEQSRLFVTELRATPEMDELHRALGAAQPVTMESK